MAWFGEHKDKFEKEKEQLEKLEKCPRCGSYSNTIDLINKPFKTTCLKCKFSGPRKIFLRHNTRQDNDLLKK